MKSAKNLNNHEKERSLATRYGNYLNKNFGMEELRKSSKKLHPKPKSNTKASTQMVSNLTNHTKPSDKKSISIMLNQKQKGTSKVTPLEEKSPGQPKININFEIKNLNIYKSSPTNPLKKGHRKALTSVQPPKHLAIADPKKGRIKPKMISSKNSPKAIGHRKAKSQDFDLPKAFNPDKFLADDGQSGIISKFHAASKAGMLEDKPKTNQDTYICIPNFLREGMSLYGVCDGHGVNGHFVSDFIKEILPENIEYYAIKNKSFAKEAKSQQVEQLLKMAFKRTATYLSQSEIDVTFSGTTTVLLLIYNEILYCANIGDSRAILCSQTSEGWKAQPLSIDHKGDEPHEAQRILKNRGRLEPYRDENGEQIGPFRVWLQDEQIPGLAMTRSFGDAVASSVGVISQPQISKCKLTRNQKFAIIASDGLWEFISNERAMEIVIHCFMRNDAVGAVKELQRQALNAWVQEDELVDDITIIVIFFKNY